MDHFLRRGWLPLRPPGWAGEAGWARLAGLSGLAGQAKNNVWCKVLRIVALVNVKNPKDFLPFALKSVKTQCNFIILVDWALYEILKLH